MEILLIVYKMIPKTSIFIIMRKNIRARYLLYNDSKKVCYFIRFIQRNTINKNTNVTSE